MPFRLAGIFPLALVVLLAFSASHSGSVVPAEPQVAGNEGYRQLWRGQSEAAVASFENAVRADAAFPYHWSDLGDALLNAGESEKASACFRRALALAPRDPQIRLRAANFCFRTGDAAQALRLDSAVLRQTPEYDGAIFLYYLRLGGELGRVLDDGIGADPRAAGEFYRFLAGRDTGDASRVDRTWQWMEQRGFVTRPLAIERASWLLARNRPAEASASWLRYVSSGARITDPGFEEQATGAAFGWHVDPCPGVEIAFDEHVAHSGHRSLRIRFDSAENLDFHHVWQNVWLTPGRYRLSAWIRTAGLTTDEGIGLRIESAKTAALTGAAGWTEVSAELTIPAARLARVEVFRKRSLKFEGRPRGSAWVDDVELRPSGDVP
jgi:hypothetical protein